MLIGYPSHVKKSPSGWPSNRESMLFPPSLSISTNMAPIGMAKPTERSNSEPLAPQESPLRYTSPLSTNSWS